MRTNALKSKEWYFEQELGRENNPTLGYGKIGEKTYLFRKSIKKVVDDREKRMFFSKVTNIFTLLKQIELLESELKYFSEEEVKYPKELLEKICLQTIHSISCSPKKIDILLKFNNLIKIKACLKNHDLACRIVSILKGNEGPHLVSASETEIAEYLWQDCLSKKAV